MVTSLRKAQKADAEELVVICLDNWYPDVLAQQGLQFSVWAECALAIDLVLLSKTFVSGTNSIGNVPLFCFNIS